MATTWIKSLHISKNRTRSSVIADIIDYVKNPEKTDGGKLISSYACDSRVADEEFMLAKKEYEHITGRNQGRREVIAYHIRQSFKPGEVDAETANKIGHELAMSFTKGQHAFIVATHIDRKHIHNHIIFNSTAISCDRKFNDFKRSGKVVRRISDILCIENGLSVIENPKLSKGRNYAKWLGNKKPSEKNKLRWKIDEVLPSCSTFEDFIKAMESAGYKVNDNGKYITMLPPGGRQARRLDTLKGDHTEMAIRERIAGLRIVTPSSGGRLNAEPPPAMLSTSSSNAGGVNTHVSLLIDIQEKIKAGKGEGYERWARIFNLKEAAKTLLFLQESGIDSYSDLVEKATTASSNFSALSKKIKDADARLVEISALQKHIGTYSKTRGTFAKYKASGYDKDFYESQRADITLHRAAKKYFDGLGLKKLPTITALKQEYAALLAEKKKLYSGYRAAKDNMRELIIAKDNATKILGLSRQSQNSQELDAERQQQRSITPKR